MKKICIIALAIVMLIPVVSFASFSDVDSTHWANTYIEELTKNNVVNGYPDGTFRPGDTLTKGAFLKLIMTASMPDLDFGNAPTNFEHWAAPYVCVAENYKIIDQFSITEENVDEPITRKEVIEILSLADIEIRKSAQVSGTRIYFTDIAGLTKKELTLLKHAVGIGVIAGYPDGTFKPDNNLTRAEASKILYQYMNNK